MTPLEQRQNLIELLNQAIASGARQDRVCAVLGVSARTVQRWRAGDR